ncbi:MAG: hydrogenase/urease accessory protein HupE [Gammaproteobacteria bacterium]|jgi:hydrogenase/urease accessory protein HupE
MQLRSPGIDLNASKFWSFRIIFVVLNLLFITLLLASSPQISAHESRPAYLDIKEESPGILYVNWTRPTRDDLALNIHPVLPEDCDSKEERAVYQLQGLLHERWVLDCGENGLTGKQIGISGLSNTISDVLLRFQTVDGKTHVAVLDTKNPVFIVSLDAVAVTNIAAYYFKLGLKHISSGADHLLFVLGLLLLINGFWKIIKTITAFTLAHSISLFAAILGYVHVPSTPVEAVIALSIMFLACELLRVNVRSLSKRLPWLIAAVFGLVHGLGFAGGLFEIGLPEGDIPLALFMFNVGVEAGQLLFVVAATGVLQVLRKFLLSWYDTIEKTTSYVMGSIAAFWLIERVSGFY